MKYILPFIQLRRLLSPEEVADEACRVISSEPSQIDISGGHDEDRPPIDRDELYLPPVPDENDAFVRLKMRLENGNGSHPIETNAGSLSVH